MTEKIRRIAIDPLTRVEGHGKVTLLMDENNHIKQARLHIVEFRGFEKFIQGRPYWELPAVVQRLCGICPVSHHLAASKAVDDLLGVKELTPTALKMREFIHYGQVLQSHALHFFHLSSPDLLFGFDDDVKHRNIFGLLADYPDLAKQGVLLRKFGQDVIEAASGKKIHGSLAVPGGVNQALSSAGRESLKAEIDRVITWSTEAVQLVKRLFMEDYEHNNSFARITSNMLSLTRSDGGFELYHGGLRAKTFDGALLFDNVDYHDYENIIHEEVKPWSYMKFPFLTALGKEEGSYRVGPLARINNCAYISTPLAEQARNDFIAIGENNMVNSTLAYHWARMIELLYCAEKLKQLLFDPDLSGNDLVVDTSLGEKGIGVIEAPRGTLFHHYEADEDGLITRANLIVSTTNNNEAMNRSVARAANTLFDGRKLSEPMLNGIEVAIRAYDPCLSCATHALGKMPLMVELLDAQGKVCAVLEKKGGMLT